MITVYSRQRRLCLLVVALSSGGGCQYSGPEQFDHEVRQTLGASIVSELWGTKGRGLTGAELIEYFKAWTLEKCRPPLRLGQFTIAKDIRMAQLQIGNRVPSERSRYWSAATDVADSVLGQLVCQDDRATAFIRQAGQVLSVQVRGEGAADIFVLSDGHKCRLSALQLTSEWSPPTPHFYATGHDVSEVEASLLLTHLVGSERVGAATITMRRDYFFGVQGGPLVDTLRSDHLEYTQGDRTAPFMTTGYLGTRLDIGTNQEVLRRYRGTKTWIEWKGFE